MSADIHEAKRRLSLPQLLEKLGMGEHAKKSCRCPFHDDKTPSFSVFEGDRGWRWKCHSNCGEGDEIDFIVRHEGLSASDAITRYLSLAGITEHKITKRMTATLFNWAACIEAFDDSDVIALKQWRGYSTAFCSWLRDSRVVGKYQGHIALPVHDDDGHVIGAHYRIQNGSWRYTAGACAAALVIGDVGNARNVHVFESQWDAFAVCEKLCAHETEGVALFITRGASNGALVAGRLPKEAEVFAWPQNDPVEKRDKNGNTPSGNWLTAVSEHSATPVRVVAIPAAHKDANDWAKAGGTAADFLAAIDAAAARDALRSLMEIAVGQAGPRKTVLGNRFLCIGSAMLFIGPSGIGKSSASMQQDILWSLGREAFGIKPQRPLRILTFQAENDDDDLAEMRDGVVRGLNLSATDCEKVRSGVFYETEYGRTGTEFIAYVEKRLSKGCFDLLRIDPLQAYCGGDLKESETISSFLRAGLGPVLQRQGVACVINHHTPKTTHRDTSLWRGSDWMYAGAGSSDLTNWARGILVIDPTHAAHVFKFIAAKRGARIGWADEFGEPETVRHFCHASDGLYWRAATLDDISAANQAAETAKKGTGSKKTADDLMALIPKDGSIPKNRLLLDASKSGIGTNKARIFLNELLEAGKVQELRVKRAHTQPEVRICLAGKGHGERPKGDVHNHLHDLHGSREHQEMDAEEELFHTPSIYGGGETVASVAVDVVEVARRMFNATTLPADELDSARREQLRLIDNILKLCDSTGRVAFTTSQIESCYIGLRGFAGEHPDVDVMLNRLNEAKGEALTWQALTRR